MDKKFEKAKNWLLDSVVCCSYPLDLLLHKDLGLHFNRAGHGLKEIELTALLYRLFSDGFFFASLHSRGLHPIEFHPTIEEIRACIHYEIDIYYGLTALGGSTWELLAQPQWNRYVEESSDGQTDEAISMDVSRVRKSLHASSWDCWPCSIENSVWDVITPWEATYWKILPRAHRVRFTTTRLSEEEMDQLIHQEPPKTRHRRETKVRQWWTERDAWYTRPW